MGTRKTRSAVSVDRFLADLDHPLKPDIEALRQVALSAVEGVCEKMKWNAPSFYTAEHFATMRLNGKVPLQLILHLGARKGAVPPGSIRDPEGMLVWLGPDRACVNFASMGDVGASKDAPMTILRQWVRHVPARAAGKPSI